MHAGATSASVLACVPVGGPLACWFTLGGHLGYSDDSVHHGGIIVYECR